MSISDLIVEATTYDMKLSLEKRAVEVVVDESSD